MTSRSLCLLAVFSALALPAGPSVAADREAATVGWQPERGVAAPSYALATPTTSNLNIDSIVLSCEQGPSRRGLQLRLYLTNDGPLAPVGVDALTLANALKSDPAVRLTVDGVRHDAELLFADDNVLVANAADGTLPVLSGELIAALETGRRLELTFDLLDSPSGRAPIPSRATLDLQAGAGGAAVAALRTCAGESPAAALAAQAPLATASRTR